MLRGLSTVYQSTSLDGVAFDPFSFQQDGLFTSKVDVGRGEIVDALVIAAVIVVGHEGLDLVFQITRQNSSSPAGCGSSECGANGEPVGDQRQQNSACSPIGEILPPRGLAAHRPVSRKHLTQITAVLGLTS
jgi:hypothetical protein